MSSKFTFDWKLYGSVIRLKRRELGYKKADDFLKELESREGLVIKKPTYYKMEQGNQPPSVEQFLCINEILYDDPFPRNSLSVCILKDIFVD